MNTKRAFVGIALLLSATGLAQPFRSARMSVDQYEGKTLKDFPVLVRLSPSTVSGFDYTDCAPDGGDIRFALEDGTALAFEKETWNPGGESVFWVQLPELRKGASFLVTYNDAEPIPLPTTNLWSAVGYAGVWHLGEASGTAATSTTNAWFTGTPDGDGKANMIAETGVVGSARRLAKTGTSTAAADMSYMKFADYSRLPISTDFTFSGWYCIRHQCGTSKYTRLVARSKNNSTTGWGVQMANGLTGFSLYDGNNKSLSASGVDLQNKWRHLAFVFAGTTASIYIDGVLKASGTIVGAKSNTLPIGVGNSDGSQSAWFDGALDEVRLCGHSLDGDWLAAEYATVRQTGFLSYGAATSTVGLTVKGDPERYGVATPSYGGHAYAIGEEVPCTVTAAETNGTLAVECTGWTLVDADGTETTGEGNRCTYVHQNGATLTWHFVRKHRLTVTTDFGGVDTNAEWVAEGTLLQLTATPDAGRRFHFWEGVPSEQAEDNPLTVTMDGTKRIAAHFARPVLYVDPKGDDANDGLDPSRPKKTPRAAVDAYYMSDIWLKPGHYKYADPLKLTNHVFLAGTGPGVLLTLNSYKSSDNSRVLNCTLGDNIVSNVAFCGIGRTKSVQGGPSVSAGLIVDCVISNYYFNGGYGNGVAAYLTGSATLRRCLIAHNVHDTTPTGTSGGGVYVAGDKALVENCTIVDNQNLHPAESRGGGGVFLDGGTVRGCLIARNSHWAGGSGVWVENGMLENCTIIDNCLPSGAPSSAVPGVYVTGGTSDRIVIRNCIIGRNLTRAGSELNYGKKGTPGFSCTYTCCANPEISGTGNLADDPCVRTDGRLSSVSPCRNRGQIQGWMTGARDIFGNPRVIGGKVDMGCHELALGLMILFR